MLACNINYLLLRPISFKQRKSIETASATATETPATSVRTTSATAQICLKNKNNKHQQRDGEETKEQQQQVKLNQKQQQQQQQQQRQRQRCCCSRMNILQSIPVIYALILIISQINIVHVEAADGLLGDLQSCSNEGEEWHVDRISKCHKCTCKNGFVKCDNGSCPSVDDCYLLDPTQSDECCRHRCKGCVYRGISYASGSEWSDPNDPCHVYKCIASVVTETTIRCYTQCNGTDIAPPQSGECCSSCQGCKINGQTIAEGQEVVSTHDRCLVCRCTGNRLTCAKKSCPVLQCPQQEYLPNECCPRCKSKRDPLILVPGRCFFNKYLHFDRVEFTPDRCTNCTCINGTSICQRNTCPIVECQVNNNTNDCCPPCLSAEVRSECIYNGTSYQNDETWNLGPCRSCRCSNGNIRCSEMRCPNIRCPSNEDLKVPDGECCPRCIESAGTCTVFGDPHFKTFDGKFYSFQGSCKYLLAADCRNHSFSIRLTNDGRGTKRSSWTKTVTLKLHGVRINFGQKLRVKVNGSRIALPYNPSGALSIERLPEGVLLKTDIGLTVEWDGNNFLQIAVPASYKHRLCGLCGNYNGIARDDLTGRNGVNHTDESVWRFANSWRVGGPKACARPNENVAIQPTCKLRKSNTNCRPLFISDVFGNCNNHLNPINYIESCRMDVCECPSHMCQCDSFAAYAHECKKLGVRLPDWRKATNCPVGLWQRNVTALAAAVMKNVLYIGGGNGDDYYVNQQERQLLLQQKRRRKNHKARKHQQHQLHQQQHQQQHLHQHQHQQQHNQLQQQNDLITKHAPKHLRPQGTPPPLH